MTVLRCLRVLPPCFWPMFGVELGVTGIVAISCRRCPLSAFGHSSGSMAGTVVFLAVGIPLEAIGLLLLIERPLDTFERR